MNRQKKGGILCGRVNYIITQLLTRDSEHGGGVDLYDISEEIFVSYETLKKDMAKVRKKLKEYGLYANVSGSEVTLEGRELSGRIADRIEAVFAVRFTELEMEELTALLISHLMNSASGT